MFEPLELELEQVNVLLASDVDLISQIDVNNGANHKGYLNQNVSGLGIMTADYLTEQKVDLVLAYGSARQHAELMEANCQKSHCALGFIDNEFTLPSVASRVLHNVKGKLDGHEMPDNVDVADIRNLYESSTTLFGFDSLQSVQAFLSSKPKLSVKGMLYLMHGAITAEQYGEVGGLLTESLSDYATLYFSHFGDGIGECTVLVAVKD